jgi:hypothetical protein
MVVHCDYTSFRENYTRKKLTVDISFRIRYTLIIEREVNMLTLRRHPSLSVVTDWGFDERED